MSDDSQNNAVKTPGRRRFLRWAAEGALLAAVFFGVQAYQKRDARRGQAPEIDAYTIDGEPIGLAQYSGRRPVLVHFWATWCPICRLEQGSIHNIAKDYPMISFAAQSGGAQEIRQFMREQNIQFPVVADPDGRWAERFGVRAFPASFIVDKTGEIHFVEIGFTTEMGLRTRLAWLDLT